MAGSLKVLLVEDDAQTLEIYSAVLKKFGYEFQTAGNGDEILQKVKSFKPQIIFLDVMLPGDKTGYDVLKILREDESYGATKTPIVILTNLGENDQVKESWKKYADGYAIKAEIDPDELDEIIKSFKIKA